MTPSPLLTEKGSGEETTTLAAPSTSSTLIFPRGEGPRVVPG